MVEKARRQGEVVDREAEAHPRTLQGKRLDWIEKWEDITTDPNIPVACLDEKWFCTAARRRKIKMLPLSDEELSSPNLASIHASDASPKI